MTNKEALEYGVKNIRKSGYVKGPVYLDGVTIPVIFGDGQLSEYDVKRMLEREQIILNEITNHLSIINRLKEAIGTDTLPDIKDLEYLLEHIDHPEAGKYVTVSSWGHWDRPTSEKVRQEANERISKIEEWESAEKQLKAMVVQIVAPNEPIQTNQWGGRWVEVPNTNPVQRKYL